MDLILIYFSFSFIFIFHFLFILILVFFFIFIILNLDKECDMILHMIIIQVTKCDRGMIQVIVIGHTQSHNIKKDIKGSGTNNII